MATERGRPTNQSRRDAVEQATTAVRLYGARHNVPITEDTARALLIRPGDPFAFIDKVVAAIQRQRSS